MILDFGPPQADWICDSSGAQSRIASPQSRIWGVLVLAITAGALAFRLPGLAERPMHCDEAVQAIKTGILAETGDYRYNPQEYHGPSLYYLSLPSVWLAGGKLATATETTFRIVPVLFGVGLIVLVLLVGDGLGRPAAACAAALTAISPAMVFYSRYYIQEMLLVFFTFAAIATGWRYARTERLAWALLTGAALALMHATKETCIIAFGSILAAVFLTELWKEWRHGVKLGVRQIVNVRHVIAVAAAGGIISILLFSSFLAEPFGPLDSIRAYVHYLNRVGEQSRHVHPWPYYLKMLLYTKHAPGPWWSEGLIVALALVGMAAAMLRKEASSLASFLACYTLLMAITYSIIPYKTPWCMLSFLHGLILLAGIGAAEIVRILPNIPAKTVACVLLLAGGCNLAGQAYRANFVFHSDNRNPYVYAHPVTDVLNLVERVEALARIHPDGHDMLIKVIAPDSDYWPLPWY
ncbi:MAG: TIGR03663 family protein, partial [Planctomycetes bacterium]|nr:TIGR03663 family protein [Planctomycetota bacterium]